MSAGRHFWIFILFRLFATTVSGQDVLPRVLIIGDSIYREPVVALSKELKGRVEVVQAVNDSTVVCHTWAGLDQLDAWLGEGKWDLIYFNFGLGDLVYRAPGMKAFRVYPLDAGGVRTTDSVQYEKNLEELVQRLKATGAKLVWGSTTPIRHSASRVFKMGSEIEYNVIAARVMKANRVPICDMYTYVLGLIDMSKPGSHGVDPFFFDRKPIHGPMIEIIKKEFGLK